MKETKKQLIYIGVESALTEQEYEFFSTYFEVKTILFKQLLDSAPDVKLSFLYFSGGADVNPSLYGEKIGKYTSIDKKRDEICAEIFHIYNQIPKLGICRGAQFLTVMNGGKLIQHVEGHISSHEISYIMNGNNYPSSLNITSTHHQMMFPFNLENNRYTLLAWATKFQSMVYLNGDNEQISLPEKFVEPEIVYYNKTNSLAIQGHPEYSSCDKATKQFCLDLINNYLI